MTIPFVDPTTLCPLERSGDTWILPGSDSVVARVIDGIPRFVTPDANYAESFGYQWKRWASARSDIRNPGHNLRGTVLGRTHFDEFDLDGKTLLECGMGGGDDTEVLLQLPFSEVHSFDLSTAVERAAIYLKDPRLTLSQASIFEIPYPDESFDVVYCHRVLQHTPDPARALESICRKVKPGGLLFAHAYKRSFVHMSEWRYKYRWLTKRLPWRQIARYVDAAGPRLHALTHRLYRTRLGAAFAYQFVPWYYISPKTHSHLSAAQILEMEQHVTFDAMTPWHDHPMSARTFKKIINDAGFEMIHLFDPRTSPIYCTAVRQR